MSGAKLKELLKSFQDNILNGVDDKLKQINAGLPQQEEYNPNQAEGMVPTFGDGKYHAFHYADAGSMKVRFWQVPRGFVFPKATRHIGWQFWMLGIPDHQEEQHDGKMKAQAISPFRLFNPNMLPLKARSSF